MGRYYRRRTYTRVVRPKKKWCSNMIPIEISNNAVNQGTQENPQWTVSLGTTLAVNKSETNSPTPVVVKTGNFKLQADIFAQSVAQQSDITIFIIYVPEGIEPLGALAVKDLMLKHPEWVIAWKKIDADPSTSTGTTVTEKITMSSRLKRNLNSGDKINIYAFSTIGNVSGSGILMRGICQFWTCAN